MRKRNKIGVVALAALLTFSAFALPKAYAAVGVEKNRECSVEINIPPQGFSELEKLEIPVNFYKVATIGVGGNYVAVSGIDTSLAVLDSDTTASEMELLAETLKTEVKNDKVQATVSGSEFKVKNGTGTKGNLATGLYLIVADVVESDDYVYDFSPIITSLPNNYYYTEGNDDWVYDLAGEKAIVLKPEKIDRYGDLIIKKTLDVYNATNPNATFVFQVEAEKTDPDTKETKNVYSNVVAIEFTEAGNKEILIKRIPAGATVTVTEVYSGASYQLKTEAVQTTEIVADDQYDIKKDNVQPGSVATVEFTNTHSGIPHGGSGVVNNFKYENNTWNWEKLEAKAN